MARRVLANQRRSEQRRTNLAERLRAQVTSLDMGGEEQEPDPCAATTVRAAMATLSDDDREILWLTAWEALTPTEASVVLGVPAATARTRLHRARTRLRAVLDGSELDEGIQHGHERDDQTGHVGTGEHVLARQPRSTR